MLVSPDGFASGSFEYGKRPQVPATLKLMRYTLPTFMVRASLAPAFGRPGAGGRRPGAPLPRPDAGARLRGAMIARLEQVMLEDPEPLLRRIRAPTLLAWGEKDRMIPIGNAADYLRNLPDARLVTYPTLGHVPQEEPALSSVGAVRAFLAG